MIRLWKLLICGLVLTLQVLQSAQAHFIWVVSENGTARIVFGEGLEPDQAEFLQGIESLEILYPKLASGPIDLVRQEKGELGWFEFGNPGDGPVALRCDYGIFARGESVMRLDYAAKFQRLGDVAKKIAGMELDLLAALDGEQVKLRVLFQGKAAADIEISLEQAGEALRTVKTDSNGEVSIAAPKSTMLLRAKSAIPVAGEVDGQAYSERRFYCTLVLAPTASEVQAKDWPDLPSELTSFGGVVLDGVYYVFGGQMDEAHSYSRTGQNGKLMRLDLQVPEAGWEVLDEGVGAQGLALLAHRGRLVRVGGFEARNATGEEHDLHSVARVAAYNLERRKWEELPALPEARSSFEACVLDDRLYVIGGWTLRGADSSTWAEDSLVLDLSNPQAEWQRFPGLPVKRRALSVVAHQGHIYAIGGMDESGKPSSQVTIFDPKTQAWRAGSDLPCQEGLRGFGCCACTVNGELLVSVADGRFFRLDQQNGDWKELTLRLEPGRFLHRIAPIHSGTSLLVLGGANMEIGKFSSVKELKLPAQGSVSTAAGRK